MTKTGFCEVLGCGEITTVLVRPVVWNEEMQESLKGRWRELCREHSEDRSARFPSVVFEVQS